MKTQDWQMVGVVVTTALGVVWTIPDAVGGSFPAILTLVLLLAIPLGVFVEVRDLRRRGLDDRVADMTRLTLQTAVFAMILAILGEMRE